jgi:hypothetical protein
LLPCLRFAALCLGHLCKKSCKQKPEGSQSGSGFSRACEFRDSPIVTTTIIQIAINMEK